MITVLTGANTYLLQHELDARIAEFSKNYGKMNIESHDVSEWEARRLLDLLSAQSLFAPERLLVLRGLGSNKPASEKAADIINAPSVGTEVVVVEPKLDKRGVLYKTFKKEVDVKDFPEADTRNLPRWLADEAKKRGGSLSLADAAFLVERVGNNQQMLSNELTKLLLFEPKISRASIQMLTDQTPNSSIFDLISAAFAGNVKKALGLYEDQRAQNVDPLAIEALFVWQLHALLLTKAAGGAGPEKVAVEGGISPYVAKKSMALASGRSMAQIKQYVRALAELEQRLKSTADDADDLMRAYILELGK